MSSNNYLTSLVSCIVCKVVLSQKGIHSHFINSHTVEGNLRVRASKPNHKIKQISKILSLNTIKEYNKNPRICQHCQTNLPYKQRVNKFCSSSCAAKFNNTNRSKNGWVPSERQRRKVSISLKKYSKVSWCKICGSMIKGKHRSCCSNKCYALLKSISLKGIKPKPLTENQEWKRRYSIHCFKSKLPLTFEEFKNKKLSPRKKKSKEERSKPFKSVKHYTIICMVCKEEKQLLVKRKTCSDECLFKSREWNCGRAKKFPVIDSTHKNCTLGSPYEYEFYLFLTANQIFWERPKPITYFSPSRNKTAKYFCDFYLPEYDLWIDPKNKYVEKLQCEKLSIVKNQINLIYGNPKYCVDQVKNIINGSGTRIRTETNR